MDLVLAARLSSSLNSVGHPTCNVSIKCHQGHAFTIADRGQIGHHRKGRDRCPSSNVLKRFTKHRVPYSHDVVATRGCEQELIVAASSKCDRPRLNLRNDKFAQSSHP